MNPQDNECEVPLPAPRRPRYFLHPSARESDTDIIVDDTEAHHNSNLDDHQDDNNESDVSDISSLESSADGADQIHSPSTPYVVPADDIVIPWQQIPPYSFHFPDSDSAMITTTQINTANTDIDHIIEIPQATSVEQSFMDQPISNKYPFLTKGRLINTCCIAILVLTVVLSTVLNLTRKNLPLSESNMMITQVPSASPTLAPLIFKWTNESLIDIDVEREDLNDLMGYSVSISEDGNTLAVGGRETFHMYHYTHHDQSWAKIADSTDLMSSTNTMENLSWGTVVCISSDGNHLIVGDQLASGVNIRSGAVMVFWKTTDQTESSQWNQVGSTIYGKRHWGMYGAHVAITDSGHRIAAGTNSASEYTAVYDYDETTSDWIEKMTISPTGPMFGKKESMAMSSDGLFLALKITNFLVVDIYDLSTFTKLQIVPCFFRDVGGSMSFSKDANIFAWSEPQSSQVHVYHYNSQNHKYSALTNSPISVFNVSGFGHSVSVSGDGRSLAVGAVSPPSQKAIMVGNIRDDMYEQWSDMISDRGYVFVFKIEHGEIEQVAEFEHNSTLYEKIGWTVSLSGDGKVVAFGSYGTGGEHGDGPVKIGQVGVNRSE